MMHVSNVRRANNGCRTPYREIISDTDYQNISKNEIIQDKLSLSRYYRKTLRRKTQKHKTQKHRNIGYL